MNRKETKEVSVRRTVCLLFVVCIGALTGVVVVAFKWAAAQVIHLSELCYDFVWGHPGWFPVWILGTIFLGWLASKTAKILGNCSGGGIPTAIAAIRGLIRFDWLKNLCVVFISALVTYLGGVPLGNEGPSVQMGTAVGKGIFTWGEKKGLIKGEYTAWQRKMMLVGASAGFAAATCAPLTGILFAFEEAHHKWSVRMVVHVALGVMAALFTSQTLGRIVGISGRLFEFVVGYTMPIREFWAAALVGLVCGCFAIIFTKLHGITGNWVRVHLSGMSPTAQKCCVFAAVAVAGFLFPEVTGSGHHLIEALLAGKSLWQLLILCLLLRAVFLLVANNMGITGGLFVPTLTMGAMIGTICARPLAEAGWISAEAIPTLIIVGTVAFLAAASHIPNMSVLLSIEAFSGLRYLMPALLGIGLAYAVVKMSKAEDFSELVVERKAASERNTQK